MPGMLFIAACGVACGYAAVFSKCEMSRTERSLLFITTTLLAIVIGAFIYTMKYGPISILTVS